MIFDPSDLALSFGAAADDYEAGRPGYPALAVAWMLESVAARRQLRVADVGAGTGKLARVVAGFGAQVVAVDPDPGMLTALNKAAPGIPTFRGSAEELPLPDGSVDAVLLGQAWHWVEPDRASREIARVLRPGGALGLIWNFRDESVDWVARLAVITDASHAELMLATGGPHVCTPFRALDHRTWRWSRTVTRGELFAMVHSRSAVITADEVTKRRMDAELGELFDSLGAVGDATVELPYVTHAYRAVAG